MVASPSFSDVFLAFRQAKRAVASERLGIGLFDFARFERELASNVERLRRLVASERWFDDIDVGRIVVIPKAEKATVAETPGLVRIGKEPPPHVDLTVRLQLQPTPDFTTTEVMYLWEFGPALETLLDDSCVAYRLKRVRTDGAMDRTDREVYEYWRDAFERYRQDPIDVARRILQSGRRVVVTSTDIVSFFDSTSPHFLLTDPFISVLLDAARRAGRPLDAERYRKATSSLLRKFKEFNTRRQSLVGRSISIEEGIPIGSLTSRVFGNVALASLDKHVTAIPGVVLYRRYVDDIVVVSSEPANDSPLQSKLDVLEGIFPRFRPTAAGGSFAIPSTGATFDLNESKTRIHILEGQSGVDFLSAVQQSFSVVTSEARAFFGNVERLETEIDYVDLFSDGSAASDRLPRLRDADRLALRRFMVSTIVSNLERSAILLHATEASVYLERRTRRLLSILEGKVQLEDFELVLSLLKIALLCGSAPLATKLRRWLDQRLGPELSERVKAVTWGSQELPRAPLIRAAQKYLRQRMREKIASAAPLEDPTGQLVSPQVLHDAKTLRRSGMRHLDREDDITVFGTLVPELPPKSVREHLAAHTALKTDVAAHQLLQQAKAFIARSNELGENIWRGMTEVSLFLSTKPPKYSDVARRFLARSESANNAQDIGNLIASCVDSLRGTRYRRSTSKIQLTVTKSLSVITITGVRSEPTPRVILSNLPISLAAFAAAANGTPLLTVERLKAFDTALRKARRAASQRISPLSSILVLPELAVPQRWARSLMQYSVREELAIVAGLEYSLGRHGLINQALGVFPIGMSQAAVVRWTKRHPARHENSELEKVGKVFAIRGKPTRRLTLQSTHGRVGVLICSEVLEGPALATLAGGIELLLVPAWNDDTGSFEHVTHASASFLVHAFVCVANNAEASDCRIVTPVREPRHEREWCRLIQRNENEVVWADLPVEDLKAFHSLSPAPTNPSSARTFRPLPPGWRIS